MIRNMLLTAATLGLVAGSPAFAGPCKDAKGKTVKCPIRKGAPKPCKPSQYVKCSKVTDASGRISYKW